MIADEPEPDAGRGSAPERRREENRALRRQLDALIAEARRNEQIMQRLRRVELRLIEVGSFPELFETLFHELRQSSEYSAVTLALCDPTGELRQLLAELEVDLAEQPDLVFLSGYSELYRLFAPAGRPYIGRYLPLLHKCAFPPQFPAPASVVMLPLKRRGRLIGSLNVGSARADRFTAGMSADFIERFAAMVAICFENVAIRARLQRVSLTDALTGVHNRRYFDQRLAEEADRARRSGRPLACLFIDADRFKQINDRHGHPAGDDVLREIARRIKAELRMSDALGRYGGEEFAAVLTDTDLATACAVAERIRAAIAAHPVAIAGGAAIPVTVSVGVAGAEPAGHADARPLAAGLLAAADACLYRAKQNGRDRVECGACASAGSGT